MPLLIKCLDLYGFEFGVAFAEGLGPVLSG
jgi:hypothetical protein